jgi:hypothetical protein
MPHKSEIQSKTGIEQNEILEGFNKGTDNKRFVWQPHGSQFTIIEEVPSSSLILRLKPPKALDKDKILKAIGFDKTWVNVEKKNKNCPNNMYGAYPSGHCA